MVSAGEVAATRAGMMKGGTADCLEMTVSSGGNGLVRVQTTVPSSGASRVSVISKMSCPPESRSPHRSSDATTSAPVTGAPSWNVRPSRRVKVYTVPSSETAQSAIWGWGSKFSSTAVSTS